MVGTGTIPVFACSHAQKDSAGQKQDPWFVHQVCVDPAEPGQVQVSFAQILCPQVTRCRHRGEIPEWSAPTRWSDPADQEEFNSQAPSKYLDWIVSVVNMGM